MDNAITLVDQKGAAEFLGISPRTLEKWRVAGGGPVFCKLGRRLVRYELRELEAFSERDRRTSTSESSA